MDDGTQVSKYLLEPAFLRELFLFELATSIALMREDLIQQDKNGRFKDLNITQTTSKSHVTSSHNAPSSYYRTVGANEDGGYNNNNSKHDGNDDFNRAVSQAMTKQRNPSGYRSSKHNSNN